MDLDQDSIRIDFRDKEDLWEILLEEEEEEVEAVEEEEEEDFKEIN